MTGLTSSHDAAKAALRDVLTHLPDPALVIVIGLGKKQQIIHQIAAPEQASGDPRVSKYVAHCLRQLADHYHKL